MNLQRIELDVFTTNPRARRAYEKVGFVAEGTRRRAQFVGGRHVDSFLMGLLADELIR
jgi:RimJ/RimL family protein N-acetyltransferase